MNITNNLWSYELAVVLSLPFLGPLFPCLLVLYCLIPLACVLWLVYWFVVRWVEEVDVLNGFWLLYSALKVLSSCLSVGILWCWVLAAA